jgi:hypothetical protein
MTDHVLFLTFVWILSGGALFSSSYSFSFSAFLACSFALFVGQTAAKVREP